ncbi:MAG TPA: Lrp/AsnC family transcriptional regulator [Thermoplasmata archaeon]|jgi:Lrp/AsnC family transcriptional regulator, leucine-responsive regulatory protein|nr:MAG TPA: Lrp/AsnC family transcriptional regulator [Thermoplasmata archaeon]
MRYMENDESEQITKDELEILTELQKNSNESVDAIAKHCGFSRQKVWRSIKRLEENHLIWGYTAVVDDEMKGLKHFTLLIKRSYRPLEEKTADVIIKRKLDDLASEMGITIENSYYVHGKYDWIITFPAQDIRYAKKFSEVILNLHPGIIKEIELMQTLYFVKKYQALNPNAKKLKEII